MCDFQQNDETGFLKNNAISCLEKDNGKILTWGQNFCEKKYIDPYTEELVRVVSTETEEEFKKLLKEEMGIEIDFTLAVKADNFKGFSKAN